MTKLIFVFLIICTASLAGSAQCDADKKALEAFDVSWSKAGQSGDKAALKIRFTDAWIKRDGRWQVWASQGTRMPAQVETAQK